MFGIILLIAAAVGIASFARGRGGNPWIWGILTIVGCFLFPSVIAFVGALLGINIDPRSEDGQLFSFIASLAWVGILAFCARYVLGRAKAQPGGMWSCPNCKYLNQPYAVLCEACRQPYGGKPQPGA